MLKLKSEKGSITLFVLASCLFFIAAVTCTQIYMQSKQIAVDREYRQIKANYETNIDENSLNTIYQNLAELKGWVDTIKVEETTLENGVLTVKFNLGTTDLSVNTIKYGWGTDSTSSDTISSWTFLESESANDTMIAINNDAGDETTYYLYIVVNNEETCLTINID